MEYWMSAREVTKPSGQDQACLGKRAVEAPRFKLELSVVLNRTEGFEQKSSRDGLQKNAVQQVRCEVSRIVG